MSKKGPSALSICMTEDIDECDTATRFEMEEDSSDPYIENDLDILLQDFIEDQTSKAQINTQLPSTSSASMGEVCEKKCQDWLSKAEIDLSAQGCSKLSAVVREKRMYKPVPVDADIKVQKVAALLLDAIKGTKSYQKYGSDEYNGKAVPMSFFDQLMADIQTNLPGALMTMIYYSFCESKTSSTELLQTRKFMLEVLRYASDAEADRSCLNQNAKVEPISTYFEESTEARNQYYHNFQVVLQSTKVNKIIFDEVEVYVNKQIESSKTCNAPWIDISNQEIYNIIVAANEKKSLTLAPEKLAKYIKKLQEYVWENILNRCITLLKHMGYNLNLCQDLEEEFYESPETISSQGSIGSFGSSLDVAVPIHHSVEGEPDLQHEDLSGILAAVGNEHASESEELVAEYVQELVSQSQDESEIENLRGLSQESASSCISISPSYSASLPRRSPDIDLEFCPSPRMLELMDPYANSIAFNDFGTGSQVSSSDESPSPKIRRLH